MTYTIYFADLEADGFLDVATKVHCCVVKGSDGSLRKFSPLDGPRYVKDMLEFLSTCKVLVMHNGVGYDLPLLERLYGWTFKGQVIDTLVLSRLLKPKRVSPPHCPNKKAPHSIEAWGYRVGRGKPEHEDWSVFSAEMLHRCSEDVEILELVYWALQEEMGEHKWGPAARLTTTLFSYLQKQEEYGWKVDKEWVHRSIRTLERWMDRIDRAVDSRLPLVLVVEEKWDKDEKEFSYVKNPFLLSGAYAARVATWMEKSGLSVERREVGGPFSRVSFRKVSLDKPSEVKELLLESGWVPLEWNTNKDGERTSPKLNKDDPFDGVEGSFGRIIAKREQCKHRKSVLLGWLKILRPDGRISAAVNNLAETARATHRGVVNVPNGDAFFGKWMRKCFIADEGKVLVGVDSDSCQVRMLVARMGDADYRRTVLTGDKDLGTDIHSVNMRAAGLDSRGNAKTFFYGFLFGAGDGKIGRIVGGSTADGRKLKEAFLEGLPALKRMVEALTKEWRSNAKRRPNRWGGVDYYDGWFVGLDGRPIFCGSEHAVLVYALQSDEAIMMATAYCWAFRRLAKKYVWGKQWGIVCWMHDEINIECDEEIAEDVRKIVEQSIVDAAEYHKINCPHKGDGKIGHNWYEAH